VGEGLDLVCYNGFIMEPDRHCPHHYEALIELAWYGRLKIIIGIGVAVYFLAQSVMLYLPGWIVPVVALSAIFLHLAGMAFDYYSTHAFLRFRALYENRGLDFPCREGNILLSHASSPAQLVFSLPTLVSLLAIPLIWLLPGIGFGMGVGRLLVGVSNLSLARQMRTDLKNRENLPSPAIRQRERHPIISSVYSSDCYC
jgi:hypothetical protein